MPEGLSFDELNKLYEDERDGDLRSMSYQQFFGEMDLSKTQKENRIRTAGDIYGFTVEALMALYYMVQDGGWLGYEEIAENMKKSYSDMLTRLGIPFTAVFDATHVEETVSEIMDATLRHMDDPYFFSRDRAKLIAENEANSVWNDSEYQDAIMSGKTMKTWHTMRDKRVRATHTLVEGVTIPINEYFQVGQALLLYPRMACEYPEEIVNCRCSVSYS